MSQGYSDNRLLQMLVSLQEQVLGALGGTPTSSRLVSLNPTGGDAGTGTATKTFPSPCQELEVCNDSDNAISFTCGSFTHPMMAREIWYGPLPTFTTVAVTAPSGSAWRVTAQSRQAE